MMRWTVCVCGLVVWMVGHAFAESACDWAKTVHPKQFASTVELSVVSSLDVTAEPEYSKGQILIKDPQTFVWRVSKEDKVHVYHGTTETGLTYAQFQKQTKSYKQISQSKILDKTWVDHFAQLVLVGQTKHYRASHMQGPDKRCRSAWTVDPSYRGPIPPFSRIDMVWLPQKNPQILTLTFQEQLGTLYQLSLTEMKWVLPPDVSERLGQFEWISQHLISHAEQSSKSTK